MPYFKLRDFYALSLSVRARLQNWAKTYGNGSALFDMWRGDWFNMAYAPDDFAQVLNENGVEFERARVVWADGYVVHN